MCTNVFVGLCVYVCVQRVGRQPSQLFFFFSLDEDFETSSLKWISIGCCCCCFFLFHVVHLGGVHGSNYDSQGHVLDFVQPALVGFGNRCPRSGCILHGWPHCCKVNFGQNW